MSLAYRSSSSATSSGTNDQVVTKPSNVAVGDLLIAIKSMNGATPTETQSGWTKIITFSSNSVVTQVIFYRIADSTDVAATNYTLTFGSNNTKVGAILAFSGGRSEQVVTGSASDVKTNNTNPVTMSNSVTNLYGISLLIMSIASADSDGGDYNKITGVSIANENPTWTSVIQTPNNGSDIFGLRVFYALRDATVTTTGNSTINISGYATNVANMSSIVISFPELKTNEISETVTYSETRLSTIKSTISETVTFTENFVSSIGRVWNKITKPVTTWINKQKN